MNEQAAWDIYFSTMAGWSLHPGYTKPENTKHTLEEAAAMADLMLEIRRRTWPSEQQQQEE